MTTALASVDVEVRATLEVYDKAMGEAKKTALETEKAAVSSMKAIEDAAKAAGDIATASMGKAAEASSGATAAMEKAATAAKAEGAAMAESAAKAGAFEKANISAASSLGELLDAQTKAANAARAGIAGGQEELALIHKLMSEKRVAANAERERAEALKQSEAAQRRATAAERESIPSKKQSAEASKEAAKAEREANRIRRESERDLRAAGRAAGQFTSSVGQMVGQLATGNISVQTFATSSGTAVSSLTALPAAAGVALGALGALAVGTVAATVAADKYVASIGQAEVALMGLGQLAGITAGQFQEMAAGVAEASDLSIGQAEAAMGVFTRAGISNGEVLKRLTADVLDYAAATGQDLKAAQAEMATGFSDIEKGVTIFNEKLNLLDAKTSEYILNLARQGRTTEAQIALERELAGAIGGTAEKIGFLASMWRSARDAAASYFSQLGKGVAVDFGGGTTEARLERLKADRERAQGALIQIPAINRRREAEIAGLEATQRAARATAEATRVEAERRKGTREATEAAQALMPWDRQRADLSERITKVETARRQGLISEVTATRALRAARVQMAALDQRAARDGARAPRSSGNSRAQSLAREAASMEANARSSRDLAEAYLESSEAGFRAEAVRQALTSATKKGIDADAQLARQLALNRAQAAASGAKALRSSEEQISAQRAANAAVADGSMTVREATEWVQQQTAQRELHVLAAQAEGEELELLTKIIERQGAAVEELNRVTAEGNALKAIEDAREANKVLEAENTLIGKNNAERRLALAQLRAMSQIRALGIDPTGESAKKILDEANRGAQLENQGELASFMNGVTTETERQIVALQQQAAMIGLTYREAAILTKQQELLAQAEAAGIPMTDANRAAIEKLAQAYGAATENSRILNEHMQALEQASSFAADSVAGFFDDIVWGSGDADQALANLVKSLGRAMFQAYALGEGPLAGILGTSNSGTVGGGSGGGLSSIFGSIFKSVFKVPVAHSGLAPGGAAATNRMISPLSLLAPSLRSSLKPGEFHAILQDGEEVVPRGGRSRSGGGDVFMTVNTPNADSFRRSDRQIGQQLKKRLSL